MTNPTVIEALKEIKNLLITKGWCQHVMARDSAGMPIRNTVSPEAVTFCLIGAIHRTFRTKEGVLSKEDKILIYDTLLANTPGFDKIKPQDVSIVLLSTYNDSCTTVDPILLLLDKSIEQLNL